MPISDEWWDKWWEQDFSWDGLAKKPWTGWVVDVSDNSRIYEKDKAPDDLTTRPATLQDYWRDQENDLWPKEDTPSAEGKKFTRFHLPLNWRDGTPTGKADWDWDWDALDDLISDRISGSAETEFVGPYLARTPKGADRRVQFQGGVFLSFKTPTTQGDDSQTRLNWRSEFAAFYGNASFSSAAFSEALVFSTAIFIGPMSVSGRGEALKTQAVDQVLELEQADKSETSDAKASLQFKGKLTEPSQPLPRTQQVIRRLKLDGAVFLDDADFTNRDILEPCEFTEAHFYRLAKFHGSRLHQGVTFLKTVFFHALSPDQIVRPPDWVLERLYEVETRRRKIRGDEPISQEKWRAAFMKTQRERAHEFAKPMTVSALERLFDETGANTDGSKISDFVRAQNEMREAYFDALEACFRTLKLYMENTQRNRQEEGRFFKLELQARRRRRRPAVPFWERILSDLYGITSDYGNSVVRPLGWIVFALIPAFAIWYALAGNLWLQMPPGDAWWDAFEFSAGRVLPFGPWAEVTPESNPLMARLFDMPETKGYGPAVAFGFRLAATFQSLSAIILVFLSGLAIRRRFQIS